MLNIRTLVQSHRSNRQRFVTHPICVVVIYFSSNAWYLVVASVVEHASFVLHHLEALVGYPEFSSCTVGVQRHKQRMLPLAFDRNKPVLKRNWIFPLPHDSALHETRKHKSMHWKLVPHCRKIKRNRCLPDEITREVEESSNQTWAVGVILQDQSSLVKGGNFNSNSIYFNAATPTS